MFYTYAYLREDGSPYYIGKGKGRRLYSSNRCFNPPKDRSRILLLKNDMSEEEAFKHEIYMISVYGRKIDGGILHNKTLGGEGAKGAIRSEEFKKKLSEYHTGRKKSKQHTLNIREGQKGIGSKLFKLVFKDGKSIVVKGLKPWCKENGYDYGCLSRVRNGIHKQHKGIVKVEKI